MREGKILERKKNKLTSLLMPRMKIFFDEAGVINFLSDGASLKADKTGKRLRFHH